MQKNDKNKKVKVFKDRDIYSDKYSTSDYSEKRYLIDVKDDDVQDADDLLMNDREKFDFDDHEKEND